MPFTKIVFALVIVINTLLPHFMVSGADNERSLSTSISGMVKLLETERELIDSVDKYADELQKKVDILKNLVKYLKEENDKSVKSPEEYLFNPLNGYALIRRMYNDWPKIELFMIEPVGEAHLAVIRKHRPDMPTATDLSEASEGLYRMQMTYHLAASEMVLGILYGKQYDVKMKSIDAYFMGYFLYGRNEFYEAGFWLYAAINDYKENDYSRIVDYGKEKPFELYAETLMQQDRPKDALLAIIQAVEMKPLDARLLNRMILIQQQASIFNGPPKTYTPPILTAFEYGCQGYFNTKVSKYNCLYNTTASPFLRLAPVKMEIINMDPYMVMFHDVISDQEIEHLKQLAKPNLQRATVYSDSKNRSLIVSGRTSKFSWFQDDTDNVTLRINQRIVDMTGFDIQGSEMLQVMNYGMGGHYDTHYDFFNASDDEPIVKKNGDRIATVLFYLSDVEQGGATVFPNIGKAVFPRKGSAVMWYNLNNKLEVDVYTMHAACPVIVGSKWVCNKWIRSKAQIFKKPCYK